MESNDLSRNERLETGQIKTAASQLLQFPDRLKTIGFSSCTAALVVVTALLSTGVQTAARGSFSRAISSAALREQSIEIVPMFLH